MTTRLWLLVSFAALFVVVAVAFSSWIQRPAYRVVSSPEKSEAVSVRVAEPVPDSTPASPTPSPSPRPTPARVAPPPSVTPVPVLVPRSLEDAIKADPGVATRIDRHFRWIQQPYSEQMRLRHDDQIRIANEMNECVGAKISQGVIETTLFYDPDPENPSELVSTHIKFHKADPPLARDQMEVVKSCVMSKVIGRRMPIKDPVRYKNGFLAYIDFQWPVEQTPIFRFLATGEWRNSPIPSDFK